jgi:hypothetical protein
MTCTEARQRILSADLAALRGESDQSLRAHLAGCPACAEDASRVIAETRRLGVAIVAREWRPEIRRASRRRTALILGPVGVAAAIMFIALRPPSIAPAAPSKAVVPNASPTVKTATSDGDTDLVASPGAGAKRAASRVVVASAAKPRVRHRNPDPKSTVSTNATPATVFAEPSGSEVSVTVGENQRAAIISTSNPKITVVWLSKGYQP